MSRTHIRRVRRMDGVPEVVTKQVEVSKLVEPQFLTLTRKPANEVAFKIVRDDSLDEDTSMTQQNQTTGLARRRVRSTKRSALLCIEFPEGATEDDVTVAVETYGLDGYTMEVTASGRYTLKRADLETLPKDMVGITIDNGRKAFVARTEPVAATPENPLPHIAVVALEFDTSVFRSEAVDEFLAAHAIESLENGTKEADGKIIVQRTDIAEGTDVRRIEVESGLVAVVARAETPDLGTTSQPFIAVVSDTAYGRWGWGQLDFNARMADKEFCNLTENALWYLRDLLDDILFYSELPIAVRKELVARATSQFSEYVGGLLDALPTKVILINRSSLDDKEKQMSKTPEQAATGDTQRSDAANADAAEAAASTTAAADDALPVTRGELKIMLAEALAGKTVTGAVETTQRSEEPGSEQTDTGTAEGAGEPAILKAVEEVVTRSTSGIAEAVKGLGERLSAIESGTVVRSGENTDEGTDAKEGKTTQRSDSPFKGLFTETFSRT